MADAKLNSLTFPNLPDRYILDAEKVEYDAAETYPAGSVGKALQSKAEVDGSYDSMTVGNAEQLVSNVRVNDKTPYLFRTSGGSVDIGDREYIDAIVGGTVAFNQLEKTNRNTESKSGITMTKNGDGSYTLNGTATVNESFLPSTVGSAEQVVNGHKYCVVSNMPTNISGLEVGIVVGGTARKRSSSGSLIYEASSVSGGVNVSYIVQNGTVLNNVKLFASRFDLTQMFGSTIADYIYSLETANAGAGVAFFRKLFPKPYYAYNAGEFKSVSGLVSHDMTGFNQWDEEWESGYWNSSGQKASSNTSIRSTNYIPVLPNTVYYMKFPTSYTGARVCQFDADKNFINRGTFTYNGTFRTDMQARFITWSSDGTTYNHDICINLSWDGTRNGEYEPYVKHSYPLDESLTLRGVLKLDANNNLHYDGDVYAPSGEVTRKYVELTFDGSSDENWGKEPANWNNNGLTVFYIKLATAGYYENDSAQSHLICNRLETTSTLGLRRTENYGYISFTGNSTYVEMAIDLADVSALRTQLASNPLTVVYELATPTTETADPYQQTQIVDDFGTEEYVIDSSTFAVPVGHDTDYPVNLVAKLEMAPNSPEGDGTYVVKQTNGVNEYVPLIIPSGIPSVPTTDGSYKLTATVSNGTTTLTWEA